MKEKIGIIGSGIVAKTLGAGFLKHGYEVMLGSRDQNKLADWQAGAGAAVQLGSFQETAAFGDILVLAVKGTAAKDVLKLVGAEHLKGKTVMDATNPIAEEAPVNGVLRFFTEQNDSLMEQLQAGFPAANFVKAYNSVGSAEMVGPGFTTKPTMFICGNSAEAKAQVSAIINLFGWEPMDMGAVEAARAIEPLCMLWCIPGFLNNEWSHAFKLLKH